jgi:ribosome-binding protein aMBF1 (putative translation factor)
VQKSLHSPQYTEFIAELREARGRAGLSQVQLAAKLKKDQAFVSKCESGLRRLDLVELREWLIALDIHLVDFVAIVDRRISGVHLGRRLMRP